MGGIILLGKLVNWLTLVEHFICNMANFKLYPVSD